MIYLFLYLFLTALANIFIHVFGLQLPNMLMVFLTTTFAILFFHLINYKTILSTYKKLLAIKELYLGTLLAVAIMWLGTFLISIYYSPAIQIFTLVCFTSLYGSISLYFENKEFQDLFKACLILAILVMFYFISFPHYSSINFSYLLVGSFLMGTFTYIYLINAFKLSKHQFKSTEILAVRFWLLWLIPLFFVVSQHQYVFIDSTAVAKTLLLSFMTLIIPIYCSQKAIEKLGPGLTGVLIGLTPFTTFILEKCLLKTTLDVVGYLSVALALVVCLPYLLKWQLGKRMKNL